MHPVENVINGGGLADPGGTAVAGLEDGAAGSDGVTGGGVDREVHPVENVINGGGLGDPGGTAVAGLEDGAAGSDGITGGGVDREVHPVENVVNGGGLDDPGGGSVSGLVDLSTRTDYVAGGGIDREVHTIQGRALVRRGSLQHPGGGISGRHSEEREASHDSECHNQMNDFSRRRCTVLTLGDSVAPVSKSIRRRRLPVSLSAS